MLVVYNAEIIDKNNAGKGYIVCDEGKILDVQYDLVDRIQLEKQFSGAQFIDANGKTVMPAFIDMHVHFRDPGLTQKEDIVSGVQAASHAGFGTVVCMPNTKPVCSSVEQARDVMERAGRQNATKVFQTVSITCGFEGNSTAHLDEIDVKEIPVITEDGFDVEDSAVMLEAMYKAAKKGIVVSCHCEDKGLSKKAKVLRQNELTARAARRDNGEPLTAQMKEDESHMQENLLYANEVLRLAEDTATYRNIELAKLAGCKIHIAHCSTVESLECVRRAKKAVSEGKAGSNGFAVTCEVTPHHFGLNENCGPVIDTLVNPPVRPENDRRAVIQALKDGTADCISTDHAPHTAEDKFNGAPGFTGIELSYAVANTVLVKEEGFSRQKLSAIMSANPAEILGLNKGLVQKGMDADLVLVDTEKEWVVDSSKFYSKGKYTPFNGKKLIGKVEGLILGGNKIW